MTGAKRIETDEAKRLRSARQHFAAPGGSHDRLVSFLGKVLPMAVGVVAALMVVTPLSPRGEVSFLLDRNKVATIDERLRVDNAMYRGQDDSGRPFSLSAATAVQRSSEEGIVRLTKIVGRILLSDGPAQITAPDAQYDISSEVVSVAGAIQVVASDGYYLVARDVSLSLPKKILTGNNGVSGEVPAGTFSAERLIANLPERTVTLDGNARLRMIPGKLRVPNP